MIFESILLFIILSIALFIYVLGFTCRDQRLSWKIKLGMTPKYLEMNDIIYCNPKYLQVNVEEWDMSVNDPRLGSKIHINKKVYRYERTPQFLVSYSARVYPVALLVLSKKPDSPYPLFQIRPAKSVYKCNFDFFRTVWYIYFAGENNIIPDCMVGGENFGINWLKIFDGYYKPSDEAKKLLSEYNGGLLGEDKNKLVVFRNKKDAEAALEYIEAIYLAEKLSG